MSYYSAYTLEEAMQNLQIWKECEREIAKGQAHSYKIGTREFTSLNIKEVHGMVVYFKNEIDKMMGRNGSNTSVRRVLPRDL